MIHFRVMTHSSLSLPARADCTTSVLFPADAEVRPRAHERRADEVREQVEDEDQQALQVARGLLQPFMPLLAQHPGLAPGEVRNVLTAPVGTRIPLGEINQCLT